MGRTKEYLPRNMMVTPLEGLQMDMISGVSLWALGYHRRKDHHAQFTELMAGGIKVRVKGRGNRPPLIIEATYAPAVSEPQVMKVVIKTTSGRIVADIKADVHASFDDGTNLVWSHPMADPSWKDMHTRLDVENMLEDVVAYIDTAVTRYRP